MSVFVCFFAFLGAKIRPAAAGTGELGWDLRDQTLHGHFNDSFGTVRAASVLWQGPSVQRLIARHASLRTLRAAANGRRSAVYIVW